MDIESKKQELVKRSIILRDQFIGKLTNDLSIYLQQKKEIEEDLKDLEKLEKEKADKKENK